MFNGLVMRLGKAIKLRLMYKSCMTNFIFCMKYPHHALLRFTDYVLIQPCILNSKK